MASPIQVLYIFKDREPTASLDSLFLCTYGNDKLFPNICSELPFLQIFTFYLYILERALARSPL